MIKRFALYVLALLIILFMVSICLGQQQRSSAKLIREQLVENARAYIQPGDLAHNGYRFDCSAYVQSVYKSVNISLPRTASGQYQQANIVASPLPGDLVFWSKTNVVSHVGIYLGENKFIHSPGANKNVRIDSISSNLKMNLTGFGSFLPN